MGEAAGSLVCLTPGPGQQRPEPHKSSSTVQRIDAENKNACPTLEMPEPKDTYAELTELLKNRRDQTYDVEILPSGLGPLVYDGCSIGITKAALVQAFFIARRIFFGSLTAKLDASLDPKDGNGRPTAEIGVDELLAPVSLAAEVILLLAPEHLTACNWRKRLLLRVLDQALPEQAMMALRCEITFTTTLLRSPLHRHTKSPTLWFHRYWILARLPLEPNSRGLGSFVSALSQGGEELAPSDLENAKRILLSELSVVLKSAEHHPMNYYAFSYIRQFLNLLERKLNQTPGDGAGSGLEPHFDRGHPHQQGQGPVTLKSLVTERVLERTHSWCLGHPGDISGWSFLGFLLELADDSAAQRSVVERTVRYAADIAWDGEALWTFLDGAIAKFDMRFDQVIPHGNAVKPTAECQKTCQKRWEMTRSWAISNWLGTEN